MPAIIGRSGLPKSNMYQLFRKVCPTPAQRYEYSTGYSRVPEAINVGFLIMGIASLTLLGCHLATCSIVLHYMVLGVPAQCSSLGDRTVIAARMPGHIRIAFACQLPVHEAHALGISRVHLCSDFVY